MMHDESGKAWAYCSVLVGPFQQGDTALANDSSMRWYFGKGYEARRGKVDLPPRAIGKWQEVGQVERIFYERTGERAPGYFQHPFKKETFFGKEIRVVLYRHDRFLRLELPDGCIINDLGFVSP